MKKDLEKEKEYYYNKDGKLVYRSADDTKEYRVDELLPEVIAELDDARCRKNYPSRALINAVISMQNESPEKAVNYIRYRLLGTASYLDVYGAEAEKRYGDDRHYKQTAELEYKIDVLQKHFEDLQKIVINLANTINREFRENRRAV